MGAIALITAINIAEASGIINITFAQEIRKATPNDRSITDITIVTHIGHIFSTIMMMFTVVSVHSMKVRMARERRGSRAEPSSLVC